MDERLSWLRSRSMSEERDLSTLVVPRKGAVDSAGDLWEPVRIVDPAGDAVTAVAAFLKDLQAWADQWRRSGPMRWTSCDGSGSSGPSRFPGIRQPESEARDFCRWLAYADKPTRAPAGGRSVSNVPNPVTGKPRLGRTYAASTRAHSETVLRVFYDFHRDVGTGPMVNPFPLSRDRRGGRANAHHNPMEPYRNDRVGLYRPRVAQRIPRCIPDALFNQVFAELGSHRDRALVALWVSTAARASELLGARCGDVDPGQQLVTVVRKGSRLDPTAPGFTRCLRLAAALSVRNRSRVADRAPMIRCGGRGDARSGR